MQRTYAFLNSWIILKRVVPRPLDFAFNLKHSSEKLITNASYFQIMTKLIHNINWMLTSVCLKNKFYKIHLLQITSNINTYSVGGPLKDTQWQMTDPIHKSQDTQLTTRKACKRWQTRGDWLLTSSKCNASKHAIRWHILHSECRQVYWHMVQHYRQGELLYRILHQSEEGTGGPWSWV